MNNKNRSLGDWILEEKALDNAAMTACKSMEFYSDHFERCERLDVRP